MLLLADVFEEFREVCYKTYGLDPAHGFTASNLAGQAFLKVCKAEIELLTQRVHLDLVERLMRGGMSGVHKRKATANNEKTLQWSPFLPKKQLFMIDVNNLYGGIMQQYCLPTKGFEIVENVSLEEILNTSENSPNGYTVEVDLYYPDELHSTHADFPLAPDKHVVDYDWLGSYQMETLQNLPIRNGKTKKPTQTLYPKHNYVLHYLTLKLYVELGLKVKRLGQVLKFEQSRWLAPYIQLNTEERRNAKNQFEEQFFKLMNNSAYVKFCEGKRNRVKVKLVRNLDEFYNSTDKQELKSIRKIDEDFAAITMRKVKIVWDKPTIVGAVILDLNLGKNFLCSTSSII